MTSFIAELKRRLPQADWPAVVAALRSQPQVWAELQDTAFADQALNSAGADREQWSPAFLGLLQIGEAQQFDALRTTPMRPVAEKLRYQAAAALEKLDSDPERPAPDLGTATLYALALRERRRLLNGWDGSLEVLGSGNPEFWKSTIAILFGLIPNPQELLAYLLSADQKNELQQLGIHALVSNPLALDVQSAHLLELVSNYPLPKFLELLRVIASVNPNLAQQAAAQALEDLHTVEGDDNELAEIQRLLLQAEVHQISGQSSKADTLLHSAWQASRQLEVDLASKLAETNGLDSEAISEIQKSAQSGKVSTKSKRPAALLSAAKVALKSGDAVEAKEMALAALKSAAKENSTDNRKAATLRGLSDLLIELNLRDEALLAAQAAADAQPNDADGALLLGKLLQENGKAAEALQQAHLAAALDPQNSEVRRNLANILFSIHLHEDAFQEWKAMLDNEVEPSSADWLAFAEAGLRSGHYDETLKACQYALVLQPTNGAAYALIGSALVAQGDEGSALAHLRRATELAPAQPDAWLALAKLQLATNDPDDAQATLVAAQQFTAPTAKMQQLLGAAYQAMDRLDEALSAYLEAAKLAETEQDMETAQTTALKVSALQMQLGYRPAALGTLEAAQRTFPNNAEIAAQLGKLLLALSDPKRALSALKQALQAQPDDIELLMDTARAQLAVNEFHSEAEQTLEAVLGRKDAPQEAMALLAEAKATQGKHGEAIKAYDAAMKSLNGDANWTKRLSLGKARAQTAAGKPVAAIETLEALDAKHDLDVQRELCLSYKAAGRGEEAAKAAEKIFTAKPGDEESLLWYAELMEALGKSAEACKVLGRSNAAVKQSPRVILSLARLQWTGESPDAAQKTLAQLSKMQDGYALAATGKFLLDKGAAKESIAYFKNALENIEPTPDILENMAAAYMATEQWSQAADVLDQAIRVAPHKPQLLEQKANVYIKLGKPQAALDSIEKSLQLMPSDARLLALKAMILHEQQDWSAAMNAAAKAFQIDPSHPGYLEQAAELATFCLQPELAREYFTSAKLAAKPSLELACLQAELALDAGMEIEAARILGSALDESHVRVLALQSQLATCRGDRSQAAQLLAKAMEIHERSEQDAFTTSGVAKAAERLNDWQSAIAFYETLAKEFRGQPLAQFNLGRAILLRAEWQRLCDASQAKLIGENDAFSKDAKTACKQAFEAAFSAAQDSSAQAMVAGWQTRAELRFGSKRDLSSLPHGFPASAAEAAALVAVAVRQGILSNVEQRIKQFANSPELLVEKAIANLETDIVAAFEFVQQAAVQWPHSAPVQALAAQIARKAGELIGALPFVQRALALWPQQAIWHALAGEIQQALGNLIEAKGYFQTAFQLEPKASQHQFALGQVLVAVHSLDDGIEKLKTAIDLEPKRAEYALALAKAYRLAGEDSQAKSYAQQAHKLAPREVVALLLQAELAMQAGDLKAAKGFSEQAIASDPSDVPALTLHAQILQALGESEDALAILDKARENAEDEVPILIQRAALAANSKGLDALVRLSQRYPERSEVFAALSKALAESGNVNDAIQAAQRAVKKSSKSTSAEQLSEMHLHLGRLLSASGNLDQSLHHLEQAAKLAPFSAASHLERGRVFQARRQQRHAIQAFQQAAALAPKDAAPHLEIGLALKEAKDYNAAEAELRKAAQLAPKDRHIQRQLAGVIALNIVHHPAEAGVAL